jgi:integrase
LKASRQRYQQGSLLKQRRANGGTDWVLRYRVTLPDGHRVQRQAVIGTTKEYPTESQAQKAADQVRLTINHKAPSAQQPTVEMVASHFKEIELCDDNPRRAWSTKQKHKDLLNFYILPRWGTIRLVDVKTVAVEAWLGTLMVTKGSKRNPEKQTMADPTKQAIRNTFSTLFTHAQRYEFASPGYNPISLVRQTGKRSRIPDILTPGEINALWHGSGKREQAMISIEYGNGLRISEAIGLKWHDIDFAKCTAVVNKSVVKGHVGETKTEASKRVVPLHAYQLEDLQAWREVAPYSGNDNWVFASHRTRGRKPYWPDAILDKQIRPLAKKLGINKRIGWHTFRRTFSSLLTDNREDVKVVQDLMRHANPKTTLLLYSQASSENLRSAQGKVMEMVRWAPMPAKPDVQEQHSDC